MQGRNNAAATSGDYARARDLASVQQFCERFPAFSEGSIRWLLFRRDINGLASAVVKLNRRVLIDVDAFFDWLARQQTS